MLATDNWNVFFTFKNWHPMLSGPIFMAGLTVLAIALLLVTENGG